MSMSTGVVLIIVRFSLQGSLLHTEACVLSPGHLRHGARSGVAADLQAEL